MRLFDVVRYPLTRFESSGVVLDALPPTTGPTSVHVVQLTAGGTIGRHRAVRRQVLAVVSGDVEVQADDDARVVVPAGSFVVWEPGEMHQTWATTDAVLAVAETSGELELDQGFTERT
ncbi:cupin domain-containing protein [Cellulomonas fimi]|uniref:Cupin 2 conserved barrel domain protein n=1 Tax=Cellulomonas fimi (strain ATCC 484 / DSM 20113 / JCM 1341 / CCUG 24087 / LMG 16345 / NBRC 15513 / NCIMB 8980 / NCTC 7547 / NRS-133) TaxID=590998 RepID=F4H307_CELFA|nr:cupin domain-containing protein [Cellulomonas fimi]AEE47625.1 Cupin 2 conserved barrel domain protein [Cellulomonas fimi ATCC 484]NNH08618.1 cupin domain-containing protein [Cellulomonas fimi]VEH36670.1 Cupin domain [Cellulomonas fimi]